MSFSFNRIVKWASRTKASPARAPQRRPARLNVECLEQRAVPATLGSLDPTFGTGGVALVAPAGVGSGFDASASAIQGDGKIILAGSAQVGGNQNTVVTRLMPDGKSIDTTFGNNGFFVLTALQGSASAVQMDGDKVVVGGSFFNQIGASAFNVTDYFVLRLTANGALDTTFGPMVSAGVRTGFAALDSGTNDLPSALIVDPNGNYLLAGSSLNPISHASEMALARFNNLGIPDGTFGNTGAPGLFEFEQTPKVSNDSAAGVAFINGGYLLAGTVSTGTGPTTAEIVRLKLSGAIDTSFGQNGVVSNVGLFADDTQISGIAVQAASANGFSEDTAILVGSHGAALTTPFVAEMNADNGNFFQPTAVPVPSSGHGFSVAIDAQQRIVLAGEAISATGDHDLLLARFKENLALDRSFGQNGVVIQNLGFADDSAAAVLLPDANTILVAGVANESMMAARIVGDIPLQARDASVTVAANSTNNAVDVLAADTGPGLKIADFSQPNNGTVTLDATGQKLVYTPFANYSGPDSFRYSIVDSEGRVAVAVVHVNVAPPVNPLTIHAPRTTHAHAGVVSFRANHVSITDQASTSTIKVSLMTTAGTIHIGKTSIKVTGNHSSRLTISGSLALVNRALANATVTGIGRHKGPVTISLFVTEGTHTARTTIRVV
jgi:uncharacterized delta-60 repeat protein